MQERGGIVICTFVTHIGGAADEVIVAVRLAPPPSTNVSPGFGVRVGTAACIFPA